MQRQLSGMRLAVMRALRSNVEMVELMARVTINVAWPSGFVGLSFGITGTQSASNAQCLNCSRCLLGFRS